MPTTRARRRRSRAARSRRPSALYDPTLQLSGKALRRSAGKLVALELDPQRRALEQESQQATTQGTALAGRAGDYYRQIAQEAQGDLDRTAAIGNLLRGRVQASGAQAQAGVTAAVDQAAQLRSGDQAVRGQIGAANATADEAQAAAQRAAAAQQGSLDTGAASDADYQRLLTLSSRATSAAGGETQRQLLTQLANRQADIASRRATVEAQQGPAVRKAVLDLRQQGFENLVTQEGLGIKRADLQASIESDRADQALAKGKLRLSARENRRRARLQREQLATTRRGQDVSADTQRRGQDVSAQQRAADRRSRETIARARRTGQKLESADAKKLKQGISNATVDLASDPKLAGKNPAEQARILRKRGAPAIVIRAARERASGGLNFDTVQELKALGIRVPRNWRRGGSHYRKPTPG